ncbi:MAG: biotin--[acetyl-CoA-carboxylase] ligase, partial [Dehalococcoidales bacterium]|nr:biotin--[acetyl-CoA-carboxylase] ligase [Dehalococcoidales bacterium]
LLPPLQGREIKGVRSTISLLNCVVLLSSIEVMEESLVPASITSNLETRFIGQRVIYHPRLASTMAVAKREAQQGAAEGTIVVADEQIAGKGRMGRAWLSPRGSLALSIILYPSLAHLPYLIMLASLAVVHSIEAITDLKLQIKWPNDVLINGKKVCGILIENSIRGDTVDYAVIGIGVNVNLELANFPDISLTATSLSNELGRGVSCLSLIRQLLAETEKLYLTLPAGESIYREWRDSLVTLGQQVRVRSGKITYRGTAESVATDGSLLLRHPDGSLSRIVAGDVTLRG